MAYDHILYYKPFLKIRHPLSILVHAKKGNYFSTDQVEEGFVRMASQDYKDGGSTGLVPVATTVTELISSAGSIDLPAVETVVPNLTDLNSLPSSTEI